MNDDLRIFVVEQNIEIDRVDVLMHYSKAVEKAVPVGMLAACINPYKHQAVILKNSTKREDNADAYNKLATAFDEVKRRYGVVECVDRRGESKTANGNNSGSKDEKNKDDARKYVEFVLSEQSASKSMSTKDSDFNFGS